MEREGKRKENALFPRILLKMFLNGERARESEKKGLVFIDVASFCLFEAYISLSSCLRYPLKSMPPLVEYAIHVTQSYLLHRLNLIEYVFRIEMLEKKTLRKPFHVGFFPVAAAAVVVVGCFLRFFFEVRIRQVT